MINRVAQDLIKTLALGFPVVIITGPRQSGKTTLAKSVFPSPDYVLLEDIDTQMRANQDPRGFLMSFPNGVILDEVQRVPELFNYLLGVVDDQKKMGHFILTGSQQFNMMEKVTQSLAGRTGIIHLLPFSIEELSLTESSLESLACKGFYPPVYDRPISPELWGQNYISSYVERDVRQLINIQDLSRFQLFLQMCANRVGHLLNLTSLANDVGITHNTARSWLSILEASYIVYLLQPYYRNHGKRLVKNPKLYFYDSGLLCRLLGIQTPETMAVHHCKGAIVESVIISDIAKHYFNHGQRPPLYFWRNNTGDEVDLLIEQGSHLLPIEIKSGKTMNSDYLKGLKKLRSLSPDFLDGILIYSGDQSYSQESIRIINWLKFCNDIKGNLNDSTAMKISQHDECLMDTRIASIGETVPHDSILNEYNLSH